MDKILKLNLYEFLFFNNIVNRNNYYKYISDKGKNCF